MLRDSALSRISIRTSILLLRAIAPASILWCILRLSQLIRPPGASTPWIAFFLVIDIYCVAEALFFLAIYLPLRWRLDRPSPYSNPLPTRTERREILERTFSAHHDPRGYLSLWFNSAPPDELYREDVKDWLCWRSFNRRGRHGFDEDELEEYLVLTETMTGITFKPGHGPFKSNAVTFEPIRTQHRPLFWYCFLVGGADLQFCSLMFWRGYRVYSLPIFHMLQTIPWRPFTLLTRHRSPAKHLSYWHLPHTSKDHLPVVFLHGIGIGLHYYLDFFKEFLANGRNTDGKQVGLLAIEYMPIAGRVTHRALSPEENASEIKAILDKHHITKCVLLSHSYGSVIAAHLLRSPLTAHLIGPLVFVDPVALSFHTPNVAFNFLRRKPTTASEIQLQYFASLDMMVANTLTRRFEWTANSLWREELERRNEQKGWKTTVCAAGADIITDVDHLGRYLTRKKSSTQWQDTYGDETDDERQEWKTRGWTGKKGLEVCWFEECNHAEEFENKYGRDDRKRIIDVLMAYSKEGAIIAQSEAQDGAFVNGNAEMDGRYGTFANSDRV